MNVLNRALPILKPMLILAAVIAPAAAAAPGEVIDVAESTWLMPDAKANLKGKAPGLGKTKGKDIAPLEFSFADDGTWDGLLNGTLMLSGSWEATTPNGKKLSLTFDDASRALIEEEQEKAIEVAILTQGQLADVELTLSQTKLTLRVKTAPKKNSATMRIKARLDFTGTISTQGDVYGVNGSIRVKGKSLTNALDPLVG